MSAFISRKLSLILLLCSYCAAAGIIFLLNYALAGPKLGAFYDILLGLRASVPVSHEILLIETDDRIEAGDVYSVLMAINEMGASDLLIETPVLGTGSGGMPGGTELGYLINDEFNVLGRNIYNLFDAIRMGLISPLESPAYVENLVELAQRGRERLNAAIVRQEGEGAARAAQAALVFGRAAAAVDLGPQIPSDIRWYSRPPVDPDRVVRRTAPVTADGIDHIAYSALKPRWTESVVELTEAGLVLINRFEIQEEEGEYRFPLDRDGNLLFENTLRNSGFRRLPLEFFREYDRADRTMARYLKEAEAKGAFSETIPEQIPLILFDYADTLKEEMLEDAVPEKKSAWIQARLEYITSLEEFLYGPAEMILVNGYEELIGGEGHEEEGIVKLQALRDELIRAFVTMRDKHSELIELRAMLEMELNSSFCIMGPVFSASGGNIPPESSALLANALLNGRCITPGRTVYIVFWSLAASFIVLACIHAMGPLTLALTGIGAGIMCGVVFSAAFVIGGYWIDPVIPAAACSGGTAVLAVCRFCIGYGRTLRFKLAYTGSVNSDTLRLLVKKGRPLLSETICADAAIIAVRNNSLPSKEDGKQPLAAAKAAREFREAFSACFKRAGAQLLGFEGSTAIACFGSPLDCVHDGISPSLRAAYCVTGLLEDPLFKECRFGIESGECAFSWSQEAGYTANGKAVVRARIYSTLAPRYKVKAIIGETAKDTACLEARKLSTLENSSSSAGSECFYELTDTFSV